MAALTPERARRNGRRSGVNRQPPAGRRWCVTCQRHWAMVGAARCVDCAEPDDWALVPVSRVRPQTQGPLVTRRQRVVEICGQAFEVVWDGT